MSTATGDQIESKDIEPIPESRSVKVRCPECQAVVICPVSGLAWDTKCQCGIEWHIELRAVGVKN